MTNCDVLIIGGGPAGSSCAWKLRRAGLQVVVWDRRTFPRDKICAGWVTPQVFTTLELEPQAYAAQGLTLQPISGFRVGRLGAAAARVDYGRPVSYGIRRCEFDNFLLARAGADLHLGEQVHALQRTGSSWILNDAIEAKLLVGAGGHFCPVAQLLGTPRRGGAEPIVAAQETEFELSPQQQRACRVEPEVPEIFFTRDLKGYGWVFRKGSYINVGLGRQDTHRLSEQVADFVAQLESCGRIPAGLPARFHGHAYLLHGETQRPLTGDAALLIGDAAGLAYARSGEGIRPAVESGLLAAQTIIEAAGRYEQRYLVAYERRITSRFGPRRKAGLPNFIPQWAAQALAGRLLKSQSFVRHVVLDRWFLHADEPALVETGCSLLGC